MKMEEFINNKLIIICLVLVFSLFAGFPEDGLAQSPVPDIKVNDTDGPVVLSQPNNLKITAALENNGITDDADWWFIAVSPFGVFFFTPSGWTNTIAPAYQGPLFHVPPITLLNLPVTGLPASKYAFYLGIDTIMDGSITWNNLYFDGVEVSFAEGLERAEGTAKITVPVLMYYLERYFSNVSEKTDLDMSISSILEDSENKEYFQLLLQTYKEIPEHKKSTLFDADTLQLTSVPTEQLNLDLIKHGIGLVEPNMVTETKPPAAPSGLAAENISKPGIEEGEELYAIELTWQDTSNEDGFLVYRAHYDSMSKLNFQLLKKVGSNVITFIDTLGKPSNTEDQYCYQVIAFKVSPISLAGHSPSQIQSSPSNVVCSYYHWAQTLPPPAGDSDNDGIPDDVDECPFVAAAGGPWTGGCPDLDADNVADKDDACPLMWGEKPDGCPLRYSIRWMKMEVLNNSGGYAYSDFKFLDDNWNEIYNEGPDASSGEEPYLIFSLANGMTEGSGKSGGGMVNSVVTHWCCGEEVDVKNNQYEEPDNDPTGEEVYNTLSLLQDLRDHGLTVFPGQPLPGQSVFNVIDYKYGLYMTTTLVERDGKIVTTAEQASKLGDLFKISNSVIGAVSTCVGTGGFGCLVSVGKALKDLIDSTSKWLQPASTVVIDDPDDLMGSTSWFLDRTTAGFNTEGTGGYGFFFDVPIPYFKSCLGWEPCPAGAGVPITMRARVYFCLYREGISESDIKKACATYSDERANVY